MIVFLFGCQLFLNRFFLLFSLFLELKEDIRLVSFRVLLESVDFVFDSEWFVLADNGL